MQQIIIKQLPPIHDPEAYRRAVAILERAFQRALRHQVQRTTQDEGEPGSQ